MIDFILDNWLLIIGSIAVLIFNLVLSLETSSGKWNRPS